MNIRHIHGLFFAAILVLPGVPACAVEHPGTIPKGAQCASCHADKTSGRSVHSAMAVSCTVCHLENIRGDMTTVSLAAPKEQICFACHSSLGLQKHSPIAKGQCLDCHDPHRSGRRLLLRERIGSTAALVSAGTVKGP